VLILCSFLKSGGKLNANFPKKQVYRFDVLYNGFSHVTASSCYT